MSGSNQTYNEAAGASVNVTGSNDTINMKSGGSVDLVSGTNDTVKMSDGGFTLAVGTTGILDGSLDTVTAGSGDSVLVSGSNDAINVGTGGYVQLQSGNGNAVTVNYGQLVALNQVTNYWMNGSNDTLTAGSGNNLIVNGVSDTLYLANADQVYLQSGTNDSVFLSAGNFTLAAATTGLLTGSANTVSAGAGDCVIISGSNNAVSLASGGYVQLQSGDGDAVILNAGSMVAAAGVTNMFLTGSNDTGSFGAGDQINLTGSNDVLNVGNGDYVNLMGGSFNDSIDGNDATIFMYPNSSVTLTGSFNTVNGAAGVQVWIAGSNNAVNLTTNDAIAFLIGNGDAIIVNSGSVYVDSNVTNSFLTGSNDVAVVGMEAQVNLAGSNDVMTTGIDDYVNVVTGSFKDSITESSGTLFLYSGTGETLIGSADTINGAAGTQLLLSGSFDVVNLTTDDAISLLAGNNDSINLSSGNIYLSSGETKFVLTGSNDTITIGGKDQITIAGPGDTISVGSSDVVYAAEGDTVILNAGDSGDTISLFGGTLVIGTGVSNITITGTGDEITGPGASLAGEISTTVSHMTGPNGVVFITTTTVPAVVYNTADVFDLVSYFEANPYLSQNQIQFLESEPGYQANLDSYVAGADLYGDSASLPSNVMAMLDGYSAVYTALAGVSPAVFSEDAYIEQQLGWAATNYPMPATIQVSGATIGIESILQNLMPVLQSTNSNTQNLVSEALSFLQAGNSGAAAGNQAPMLDDTVAEMLLGIAETPGYSASTQASDEVYTPGRSGHWQIIVNGDGSNSEVFKSPPLIQTVLADFGNYVAPIIDIVAVVCLNPEFIAATELASSVTIGIEVAADAVNLVQAGQAFAVGDDLQGIFGVLNTIGGVLQQIGGAQVLPSGAAAATGATNGFQQLGEALSDGTAVAQGIDGLASGGNFLSALDNALGAIGGVAGSAGIAGLAGYSDIQKFALVGQALASTAQSGGSGDILAALDSLVQAANTSGALSGIIAATNSVLQDIESMWNGFEQQTLGVVAGAAPDTNSAYSTAVLTFTPYQTRGQNLVSLPVGAWGTNSYSILYNASGTPVGISYLDPTPTAAADNSSIIAGINQTALADGVNGQQMQFIVVGHGNPTGLASTPSSMTQISPEATLATMEQAGYVSGQNIEIFACNAGSPNTAQGMTYQFVPSTSGGQGNLELLPANINGNPTGSNFAQTLATLAHSLNVTAFNGYDIMFPSGAYFLSQNFIPNGSPLSTITGPLPPLGQFAAPTGVTPGSIQHFHWNPT